MKRFIIATLWILGGYLLGQGIYMDVKAKVAQVLIASSWDKRGEAKAPAKPWWWADTRAIARLEIPRLNQTRYVMQDDSGESLAFGPGHMPASAAPSEEGHVVIAGHRDSHFAFLQEVKIGDLISTENSHSDTKHYRVTELLIIDSRKQQIPLLDDTQLTLITCYPFDDFVPGGPLRFVINAKPILSDELAANTENL